MVRSCLLRQRSSAFSTSGGMTFFQRKASPRSMIKVRPTIEVGISKNMIGPPSFRNCHIYSLSASAPTVHLYLRVTLSDDAVRLVFVVERELEQSVVAPKVFLHSLRPTREGRGLFDRPLTEQ